MRGRRTVAAACVLALLAAAACRRDSAGGAARGGSGTVAVEALTVEPVAIARTLFAVGSLESPESTRLAAEIGGRIVALDVPEGQQVEAGHVLARIDEEEARARLAVARSRFHNAQDSLERIRSLRKKRVVSQQELDDAVAALEQTEGELEEAQTRLRKTHIDAPFTGILGLREVSLGAYLEPGDPIVRITQTDPLELVFRLPQRHVGELAVGQRVRGRTGTCGERFAGRVNVVEPYVDPATRTVQLQALIANADGRLLPGMAASVKVEIDDVPDALLVPQEAVVRQGTRKLVYVVGEDGSVEPREVSLGEFFPDQVQVTKGIEPGAVVVAAGHQKLRPGVKAEVKPYEPIENPNLELGSDGVTCEF